jgi:hypothetical protein
MTETILTIKLTHKKELPPNLTDEVAQRTYMYLYSRGCESGVQATLATLPKEPGSKDE